jgi:tetratricopeptide (TPR) repeat protein
MRPELPSDFPAALGSLDEADLPVISPGLPAARPPVPVVRPTAKPGAPAAKPAAPAAVAQPAEPPGPFGDVDLDLPVVAADLPAAKADLPAPRADLPATRADLPVAKAAAKAAARPGAPPAARPAAAPPKAPPAAAARPASPAALASPTAPARASFDFDLPIVAGNLPSVKRADDGVDLPIIAADLPAPAASLPVVAADLPSPAASLPVPAANLPSVAASLPVPAQVLPVAKAFGEIDLPDVAEMLPTPLGAEPRAQPSAASSGFGEIDLPPEQPAAHGVVKDSADFGDLDLGERPRSGRPPPVPPGASVRTEVSVAGDAQNAMAFGEVDFGGGGGEAGIGVDANGVPRSQFPGGPGMHAAATAPVSVRPGGGAVVRGPAAAEPGKRRYGKVVAGAVVALLVVGGAALQLTSYGAFGYLAIGDRMHAADYTRATTSAMADTEKALGPDTYDAAKAAVDAAASAHVRNPRVKPLAAYAAIVDAATTLRFGADPARTAQAKRWLGELPPGEPVKYREIAQAAQSAAEGDLDKARKGLDAASKRDAGDPIQLEVALLRGGVELAARDGAAALAAYKQALALSQDARVHFGLARAYDMMGDDANAKKELEATLAVSPEHPGALTLRARMKSATSDGAQALADVGKVLDGPARAKASPEELSRAYAAKAWISLRRGQASDARDAFAQAVKLNPRNVDALTGEGRLLLGEGRFTEALARFDTALQADPSSPDVIASDAEAKIALERLADAKQQLLDAKAKFPKSIPVLLLLGKAEQHLGNNDAAETDLRAAMALVDPKRPDAVLPFVALAELQAARGRVSDASATLEDARKKLPASATLDRAFGEVADLQGEYETAITHYRAALQKDPKDVVTHFRLAVTLRRVRKFDEASGELDRVAAVDKDYPGLSLERGLLFEESGDVQKAIEQFKGALAKAPNDPDLQLRVGSAYVAIGRPDDALPMLRKVLEKRPTSAEAHHYIGRALMLKGGVEAADAIRYLKRAVDLDPNRAEFHVYLAWAANDAPTPKLELARDEIDKALALDKLNPEAYWQKGVLERMQGAIDDAIADERKALALRPSRYEAHATLAECLEDKNDLAGASAEWAKAIAGEGSAANAEGTERHPLWHYRYGKLLYDHGNVGGALAQLLPAAQAAEKSEQHPGWLGPVEYLTAESLRKSGRKADAIEHYRRYLEIAPVNSPDRADAQAALNQLTGGQH